MKSSEKVLVPVLDDCKGNNNQSKKPSDLKTMTKHVENKVCSFRMYELLNINKKRSKEG